MLTLGNIMFRFTPLSIAQQLVNMRLSFGPKSSFALDEKTIPEGAAQLIQALKNTDPESIQLDGVTADSLKKLYGGITYLMDVTGVPDQDVNIIYDIINPLNRRVLTTKATKSDQKQEVGTPTASVTQVPQTDQKHVTSSAAAANVQIKTNSETRIPAVSTTAVNEIMRTALALRNAINNLTNYVDKSSLNHRYLKNIYEILGRAQQIGSPIISDLYYLSISIPELISANNSVREFEDAQIDVYEALEKFQKAACKQSREHSKAPLPASSGNAVPQKTKNETEIDTKVDTSDKADKKSTSSEEAPANQNQSSIYTEADRLLSEVYWLPCMGTHSLQIDALNIGFKDKFSVTENGKRLKVEKFKDDNGVEFYSFKADKANWHICKTESGYLLKRVSVILPHFGNKQVNNQFHQMWLHFHPSNEAVGFKMIGRKIHVCVEYHQLSQFIQIYHELAQEYPQFGNFKAPPSAELEKFRKDPNQAGKMLTGYIDMSAVVEPSIAAEFFYKLAARCAKEGIQPNGFPIDGDREIKGTENLISSRDDDAFLLLPFSQTDEPGVPKLKKEGIRLINDDNAADILAELKDSKDNFLIRKAYTRYKDVRLQTTVCAGKVTLNPVYSSDKKARTIPYSIEIPVENPNKNDLPPHHDCPGGKRLHSSEWYDLATYDLPVPIDVLKERLVEHNIRVVPTIIPNDTYSELNVTLSTAIEPSSNFTFVDEVESWGINNLQKQIQQSQTQNAESSQTLPVTANTVTSASTGFVRQIANNSSRMTHTSWFQPAEAAVSPTEPKSIQTATTASQRGAHASWFNPAS